MNLCAIDDNKIVGYAALETRSDIQTQGYVGFLSELIVDGSCRGKGIGKELIKEISKEAKKIKCREIQFPSTFRRKKAHKFYESMGFKKTSFFFWKLI